MLHMYDVVRCDAQMIGNVESWRQTIYVCRWCGTQLVVMGHTLPFAIDASFCPKAPRPASPTIFVCSHGFRQEDCPECIRDDCPCETCAPVEPYIDF